MKRVLQETFEATWLPNITEAAAQRYIETDIGGRYVDQSWPEFAVAEIDGAVAGLIHSRADFIEALHVMASRQGQGVGRKLLSHAEQAIGAAGLAQARLETDTFKLPAQALYKAVAMSRKTAIRTTNGAVASPPFCSRSGCRSLLDLTCPDVGTNVAQGCRPTTRFCPLPPFNDLAPAFKQPSRISYKTGTWRRGRRRRTDMQNEREIDALLSPGEAGSIIDRLMAMPRKRDDARISNEWDRAVASRFETRLARQMRSQIDDDRQNAA